MTTPEGSLLPTHRIRIVDVDNAMSEIRVALEALAAAGERPWAEVFYPPPADYSHDAKAAWEEGQATAYDAVELVDGEIVTLPPYLELVGGAS